MENNAQTYENVDLIRGEPEKAIKKLSVPTILIMLFIAGYYLVDGIWIVGLGETAIAGIGFLNPFFMILLGISLGISNGIASSISRFIGAKDHNGANMSAMHSILILIIISIILTVLLLLLQKPLLILLGAGGETLNEGLKYGTPLFSGLFVLVFLIGFTGIFRGEGDMKRPMYIIGAAVILNTVLDPIFIYILNLGSAGASITTIFSAFFALTVMTYWILIKNDVYIDINFKNFKFDSEISYDILKVGIPSSMDMVIQNIALGMNLMLISMIGGDYGVAVFSSAQRVYVFASLPLNAVGTTVTTVSGSAFGAKNGDYISRSHIYGSKMALIIGMLFLIIFIIFANPLAGILAFTPETSHLIGGIVSFLQIGTLSLPLTGIGAASSYFYQGIGKGTISLTWTIIRDVIFTNVLIYVFGILFGWGLIGAWAGLAVGKIITSAFNFLFARYTVKKINEMVNVA